MIHGSTGRGAQGHANADGLCLPGNGVRDDTVDAERCEKQAEGGEGGDQKHEEAARRNGAVNYGLDGPELGGGLARVQLAKGMKDAGGECGRRKAGANDELHAGRALLRFREVHLPAWLTLGVAVVDIGDGTDNQPINAVDGEDFPCGLLTWEEEAGNSFIEDHDLGAVGLVVPAEIPSAEGHTHRVKVAGCDDVG